MRQARLKAPPNSPSGTAYYHCVSRVVDRRFVLGEAEKTEFLRLMRIYERLCGLRVVAYCLMSNHFHLLVGVPKKPEAEPTNDALITLVRATLGDLEATRLELQFNEAAKLRPATAAQWQSEIRQRYLRRMWDISLFMKTLKQRFTQWFNRVHQRKGTLWEDRFKSVLVQSAGEPLRAIAAYIDLNPIRAALVEDPKDYPWSSYGAASEGDLHALAGLSEIQSAALAGADPQALAAQQKALQKRAKAQRNADTLAAHRALLYGRGEERGVAANGRALKKAFNREQARQVVAQGGRLPQSAYLRCRVRYFTEGAVIGDRHFVNAIFQSQRHRHGPRRKTGARLLAGLSKDQKLYALRDLKRQALN